jgi:hypothetical protein
MARLCHPELEQSFRPGILRLLFITRSLPAANVIRGFLVHAGREHGRACSPAINVAALSITNAIPPLGQVAPAPTLPNRIRCNVRPVVASNLSGFRALPFRPTASVTRTAPKSVTRHSKIRDFCFDAQGELPPKGVLLRCNNTLDIRPAQWHLTHCAAHKAP